MDRPAKTVYEELRDKYIAERERAEKAEKEIKEYKGYLQDAAKDYAEMTEKWMDSEEKLIKAEKERDEGLSNQRRRMGQEIDDLHEELKRVRQVASEQLTISDKALELASFKLTDQYHQTIWIDKKYTPDYFRHQAEEQIKQAQAEREGKNEKGAT